MALLNYKGEVLSVIALYASLTPLNITGENYYKLLFSGDGHVITHGRDYTPLITDSTCIDRGLVKPFDEDKQATGDSVSTQYKSVLRGTGDWATILTQDLPMGSVFNPSPTTLPSTEDVYNYVSDAIAANDVMQYKGVVNSAADINKYYTDEEAVPLKGDTFRVGTAFESDEFTPTKVEPGDMIICLTDVATGGSWTDAEWLVVQTNINGAVTDTINGTTTATRYSNDAAGYNIYAPVTSGDVNQVLLSEGANKAPTWHDQSELVVGKLLGDGGSYNADELLKTVSNNCSNSGMLTTTVQVAGTSIESDEIAVIATKVVNSLKLTDSFTFVDSSEAASSLDYYNGSAEQYLALNPASYSETFLGGVIVDPKGSKKDGYIGKKTISVVTEEDSEFGAIGSIYLTEENIVNALGYVPENIAATVTHSWVLADTATSTTDVDASSPFFNLIETNVTDNTVKVIDFIQFKTADNNHAEITCSGSNLVFAIKEATTDLYGGVKLYSTAEYQEFEQNPASLSKKYALKLDSDHKAYVDVPWTYNYRAIQIDGAEFLYSVVESAVGANPMNLVSGDKVTITNEGNGAVKFTSTWRKLYFGTVENHEEISYEDHLLFEANDSSNVQFEGIERHEGGITGITLGLYWFNLDEGEIEGV